MNVSIIFDLAYGGTAADTLWIIDTAVNRSWFDKQVDLDTASAVFTIDRYTTSDEAVVHVVWNAQEHSPTWTTINVTGMPLSDRVADDLANDGVILITSNGFRLDRP